MTTLALVAVSVAFAAYVVLRERAIRRLAARLADETERSRRMAEQERVRGELIADVTHQLKTPLTSLLGYATILRKRARTLPEGQREDYFDVLERQGERILYLVNELLQSSRIEAEATRLRRLPVDLAGIMMRLASELGGGQGRDVEVSVPDHDLGLFGDPAAIEHVLTNLLDNALKYSQPGDAVRLEVVESDGEILILVGDEGAGIAPDALPQVFERFQRAPNAPGNGGVGLGLWIVKTLVEAHGGGVRVDSELGKGTTFTVALPRRRAREA